MKYYYIPRQYKVKRMEFRGNEMEIGYEESVDDLVIMFESDYKYKNSVEISPGYIVDLDVNDKIVAIEIIGVSEELNVDKEYIKKAKIDAYMEMYEYSYKIVIDFNDGDRKINRRILR